MFLAPGSWQIFLADGWVSAGLEVGHIRASAERDVPSRLAQGRRARRPRDRQVRRQPEVTQDAVDDRPLVDRRDEPQPPAIPRLGSGWP
jgi:hypothetical protein